MSWSAVDDARMARALALAAQGRGRTAPNPMVGCVVARDGAILSEGFHAACGQAHAEVAALAPLGGRAEGATLYVTLEPCSHWGRTPPCVQAVLASGVHRVVVAMQDPDPRVDGRGLRALRAAGILVEVGLREAEARALNERYLVKTLLRRPFVTLKVAATLDGRTATRRGTSAWITGEEARRHARGERALSQAIVFGVGTVLADDPRGTVRDGADPLPARDPARVVLDSALRTPPGARVLARDGVPVYVCTTEPALASPRAAALAAAGAILLPCGPGPRVELRLALRALFERQIVDVFVEGGAEVHGAFFDLGLVDRYLLYLAPKLFGGEGAAPIARGVGVADPAQALPMLPPEVLRLGDDLLLLTRPRDGLAVRGPSPEDLARARSVRHDGEPMFTGIVTSVGTVVAVADAPAGKRISVRSTWDSPDLVLGESIAVDGACMTVVAADGPTFGFDASPESLARTTLGDLRSGAAVNLERALRLGDRLGGHHVTGHVDARGELAAIAPHGDCLSVTFAVGAEWLRYLVPKGSVAVDGISLTVNRVDDASRTFEVMIIPHTQEETSLAGKGPGSAVNLELDLLGKYVERLLAGRGA